MRNYPLCITNFALAYIALNVISNAVPQSVQNQIISSSAPKSLKANIFGLQAVKDLNPQLDLSNLESTDPIGISFQAELDDLKKVWYSPSL